MSKKTDELEKLDKVMLLFERDLMRVAEEAEAAADNDISGKQQEQAIQKALAKSKEYKSIVSQLKELSKVRLEAFVEQHDFNIGLIHESLEKLGIPH